MNYLILDLETTAKCSYKRKGNPFDMRNRCCMWAWKSNTDLDVQYAYDPTGIKLEQCEGFLKSLETCDVIVGHNLKFDLTYYWKDEWLFNFLKRGGMIFDTMVAEYLLSAQQVRYPSLNYVSEKYGGELKDEQVKKDYFEQEIGAEGIPLEILVPYARGDIINTELVYMNQLRQLELKGLLPLFRGYMDHELALIEMEYNGLHVDKDAAIRVTNELKKDLEEIQLKLIKIVTPMYLDINRLSCKLVAFNPNSTGDISAVLFGTGVHYYVMVDSIDRWGRPRMDGKTEKPKQKLERRHKFLFKVNEEKIEGAHFNLSPQFTSPDQGSIVGAYKTDRQVLLRYLELPKLAEPVREFIELILEYREKNKILTTYLKGNADKGLLNLIHFDDGLIHHQLDMVQTVTGRLNGRNPNMQNIPKHMRKFFTSRFENGKIVEYDYSQLEIVVQAWLSGCNKMMADIVNGVDFHIKRLAYAEGKSYEEVFELVTRERDSNRNSNIWAEKRRKAKAVSFQKAYGASAESIAKKTGLKQTVVETIFQAEDQEYPEIGRFLKEVEENVYQSRVPSSVPLKIKDKDKYNAKMTDAYYEDGVLDGLYYPQGIGYYQSITGKLYGFREYGVTSEKLRYRGKPVFTYFKVPDMADYPVQGTAADIVALSVGRVFRELLDRDWLDDIRMINEVHDSLINDCKPNVSEKRMLFVKEILEDVPGTLKRYLGINCSAVFKVEMQVGKDWKGTESVDNDE